MNRYLLQDVDCILAMSGGMDSVALLHWLLENNKKPYIFTKFFKSNDVFNDYLNHKLKKI